MVLSSAFYRSSSQVFCRSPSSFTTGRWCKYYVSSTRPTEQPLPDLATNVTPATIHLPPPMIRPPSSTSQHHHPNSVSNKSSGDYILLDNDLSSTAAVPIILASDHHPQIDVTRPSPKANSVLHRSPSASSTLTHHFDTFALVERLQTEGGFTKKQARFLMEIMQQQIRARVVTTKDDLLASSQLENEAHVLSASIDDLRNAVTISRKNDAALLQAELTSISRDIENLEQQLNEDVVYLHNSIDLTLNDFRTDIRQEQKVTMIETQQVNHRLTVLQADANMALERLKWETIWQSLLSIVVTSMGLTMVGFGLSSLRSKKVAPPAIERSEIDHTLTIADMEI
ncbi:hypothetical protein BCR42DRAFT_404033 [Absidia repens]|uniref:DUF1640-domain-containing protein n=1 Tax=Absidia repens TaxID=90262 RepID=A0A1X2IVM5_9FUNG|nr:hypothetical protein BCR42DRAFT_404033 [Absidia repens]